MDFVAFDFETANEERISACALGVAVVRAGAVVERTSWLIRPPELRFSTFSVAVHGLTAEDVETMPPFGYLWADIRPYLDGAEAVAHCAEFDVSVLGAVLDEYNLPHPRLACYCTEALAKRVWPEQGRYGLDVLAARVGAELTHHDAQADAAACAEVALACCREIGARSVEDLARELGVVACRLQNN